MNSFWDGFEKRAALFNVGADPKLLSQLERFNKNIEDVKEIAEKLPDMVERSGKSISEDVFKNLNKSMKDVKSTADKIPDMMERAGKEISQDVFERIQDSKKLMVFE